jgi:hypothetical protein
MEGFELVIYVRNLSMLDAGNDLSTQAVFYLTQYN